MNLTPARDRLEMDRMREHLRKVHRVPDATTLPASPERRGPGGIRGILIGTNNPERQLAAAQKALEVQTRDPLRGLTAKEKAVLVARSLREPFTLERLLVECWKSFPIKFGLDGYQDSYPDNRKLAAIVYGAKGLIRQGVLLLEGELYRAAPDS